MFKDNPNNDEAVKEAYRYAFRDYKTWNRTINYYRCTTYRNTTELMRPEGGRWNISVRTLHIFGAADTAISVQPAKDSAAWVEDYLLSCWRGCRTGCRSRSPILST